MAPSKMLALLALLALSWSAATAVIFPQVIPTIPTFTAINHPCTQYCMLQQPFTTAVGSPLLSLPFLPQQQAFPIIVSPWQQQQCMLHCVAGAQIQQQQRQIVTISNPVAATVQFPYLSSPLTAAMQVPFLSNPLATTALQVPFLSNPLATTALQVPFLSNPLTTAAIQSPYLYNPMAAAIQSSYLFNPVTQSPYLFNPVAMPMQVPFLSNPMAAAMQLQCAF